jgi:hypothetical protein
MTARDIAAELDALTARIEALEPRPARAAGSLPPPAERKRYRFEFPDPEPGNPLRSPCPLVEPISPPRQPAPKAGSEP